MRTASARGRAQHTWPCACRGPRRQGQLELQSHHQPKLFQGKGPWRELWLQQSSSAVSAGSAMAPSTTRRRQRHIIQYKLKAPHQLFREEATTFPDTAHEPNPPAKRCVCHRPYRDEMIQKARGLGSLGPWCQRKLFLQSEGVSKYYPLPSLPMSLSPSHRGLSSQGKGKNKPGVFNESISSRLKGI